MKWQMTSGVSLHPPKPTITFESVYWRKYITSLRTINAVLQIIGLLWVLMVQAKLRLLANGKTSSRYCKHDLELQGRLATPPPPSSRQSIDRIESEPPKI